MQGFTYKIYLICDLREKSVNKEITELATQVQELYLINAKITVSNRIIMTYKRQNTSKISKIESFSPIFFWIHSTYNLNLPSASFYREREVEPDSRSTKNLPQAG